MPSSTAWSITPTASISTARACGEPENPAERPEPVALWTCRSAWTTQQRCPHAHSRATADEEGLKPRFNVDPAASPMPETNSQNASRPGRHQIGMVGEIISESWARSNLYTGARSSESADELEAMEKRLEAMIQAAKLVQPA